MSYVPMVIERTNNGERSYDIYSRLLRDRIIVLSDEVNDVTASIIIAQMLFLEAEDPDKDIIFYINCPGGSTTAGLAIYDTMQYVKADISTICIGMAASMASCLLAGGAKGKRYALPNSEIMIHQPSVAGGMSGPASDIKIYADRIIKTKKRFIEIYSEKTGQSKERLEHDMDRDNYMTSQEAKEYGIIDEILVPKSL